MTKPLNQEEKERLSAYKEQFKALDEFAEDLEFLRRSIPPLDMLLDKRVVGSPEFNQIAEAKARLIDYIDLLEREQL